MRRSDMTTSTPGMRKVMREAAAAPHHGSTGNPVTAPLKALVAGAARAAQAHWSAPVKRSALRGTATGVLLLIGIASFPGMVRAQIPDKYTNLQILPTEITKGDLVGRMREIAGSLGVRCNHCHLGPDDLQGMDFATDEKATKRTARVMMKMVEEINGRLLKPVDTGRAEVTQVRCITCHHGITVPKPIHEIVAHSIEQKGVGPALTEYRDLRKQYYGSSAYDFSQGPLNYIVEKLVRQQKLDDAFAIATTNIELNPTDAFPQMLLGRIHLARGEKELAIAAIRKAVELDPTNTWAKKQLDDLTAPEAKKE